MTYDEFLAALRKTPRDWRLTQFGALRRYTKPLRECPLSSVTGCNDDFLSPKVAAVKLGLTMKEGEDIIFAADNCFADPRIRSDLLAACGIKEDDNG